jgi:hypothetical protein
MQTRYRAHLDSYLMGTMAFFFKVKGTQLIRHFFILLRLTLFIAVLSHPLYILVDFR